jgi:secreted trypsin-like serine protease
MALGWGSTTAGPTGEFPDAMRQTAIGVEPDSACSLVYGDGYNAATMLCAGVPAGGRDTCQGDSGGPLVSGAPGNGVVIGFTSFGGTCGQPGAPGAYVRASVAAGWIAGGALTSADRTAALPQRKATGIRPIAKPSRSRTRARR